MAGKLRGRRERRFLELVSFGATITEASRAVLVSRMTVHRRATADSMFAAELAAARAVPSALEGADRGVAILEDWRVIAARLETDFPEHWSLPMPDLGEWDD